MSTPSSSSSSSMREKKVTPLTARRAVMRRTHRSDALLQELRLRLANLLQTTLDSSEILHLFYQEMQQAVAIDGMTYRHRIAGLDHSVGAAGQHRATYRLTTQDNDYGEIEFSRRQRFAETELSKLESLLDLFVYPIRNAIRYQEALQSALTDPLTGTGNRLALGNVMKREIELCRRYDRSMSVLMLDIDCFKNVNDLYGHAVGDKVLQKVADIMRNSLRDADSLYRMGGEEFLILLSETGLAEATLIARRVCQNIAEYTAQSETTPTVTASLGVCTYQRNLSLDQFLNAADQAMYQAKRQGRNRVMVAPPEAPSAIGD